MCVVIGLIANLLFLINITSEFFILHFFANISVRPIFFLLSKFLFIGQFINPATFLVKDNL